MKLRTNGALILVRLGKVSLRHTETMIPRGRVDSEITKEPNRFEKVHCRLPSRIKPKRIIQPQRRSRRERKERDPVLLRLYADHEKPGGAS